MNKDKNGRVDEGTTVLGIRVENGVIFASDRKTSRGLLISSKDSQKIRKINSRAIFTRVGSVADSQEIEDHLRHESKMYKLRRGRRMSIETLAEVGSNRLRDGGHYHTYPIVGGVDEGGPRIFTMDAAGSMLEEKSFTAVGSGSKVAYGTLESNYESGLSVQEAEVLATRAVQSAIERDNMSGCGITIGTVTEEGAEVENYENVDEMLE